jgi:hypothetical protein
VRGTYTLQIPGYHPCRADISVNDAEAIAVVAGQLHISVARGRHFVSLRSASAKEVVSVHVSLPLDGVDAATPAVAPSSGDPIWDATLPPLPLQDRNMQVRCVSRHLVAIAVSLGLVATCVRVCMQTLVVEVRSADGTVIGDCTLPLLSFVKAAAAASASAATATATATTAGAGAGSAATVPAATVVREWLQLFQPASRTASSGPVKAGEVLLSVQFVADGTLDSALSLPRGPVSFESATGLLHVRVLGAVLPADSGRKNRFIEVEASDGKWQEVTPTLDNADHRPKWSHAFSTPVDWDPQGALCPVFSFAVKHRSLLGSSTDGEATLSLPPFVLCPRQVRAAVCEAVCRARGCNGSCWLARSSCYVPYRFEMPRRAAAVCPLRWSFTRTRSHATHRYSPTSERSRRSIIVVRTTRGVATRLHAFSTAVPVRITR